MVLCGFCMSCFGNNIFCGGLCSPYLFSFSLFSFSSSIFSSLLVSIFLASLSLSPPDFYFLPSLHSSPNFYFLPSLFFFFPTHLTCRDTVSSNGMSCRIFPTVATWSEKISNSGISWGTTPPSRMV